MALMPASGQPAEADPLQLRGRLAVAHGVDDALAQFMQHGGGGGGVRLDDAAAVVVLGRDGDAGHGNGGCAGVKDKIDLDGEESGEGGEGADDGVLLITIRSARFHWSSKALWEALKNGNSQN